MKAALVVRMQDNDQRMEVQIHKMVELDDNNDMNRCSLPYMSRADSHIAPRGSETVHLVGSWCDM